MQTTKLTLGLAALAATAGMALPAAASANALQGGAALLSVATEEFAQRTNDASSATGDITCTVQADGGPVTPEANFVVGEIFAQDLGIGQAKCVSFTNSSYTMRLTTKIQSFTGTSWVDVLGCSSTTTGVVTNGVGVVPVGQVRCAFDDMDSHLDRYHRTYTTLTQTVSTKQFHDTSATWYQRRG